MRTALTFSIVIPVVQTDLAGELISQLARGTMAPKRIIVIDNSGMGFDPKSKIPVTRVVGPSPLGVNESWNMGISLSLGCGTDLIGIFNDDICIGRTMLENIEVAMRTYPDCGAACPEIVPLEEVDESHVPVDVEGMDQREGWAFVFRQEVLKKIPLIPNELEMFFGDDWLWEWTYRLGYYWMRVIGARIYHYGGKSVKQLGVRSKLNREREIFNKLMEEL